MTDFNTYSTALPILVGGINYSQGTIVKFWRPGMADSVTEAQSHDKGRGGRSLTGVHRSVMVVQNRSVT